MLQTTPVQPLAHNNTVLNSFDKKIKASGNKGIDFLRIADQNKLKDNEVTLVEWFSNHHVVRVVGHTLVPAGKLYYQDRLKLKFTLTDDFISHFALLRGLFSFAKSAGLLISSSGSDKTFTIETSANQVETAIDYLEKTVNWFSREIKFKEALKQIIRWEYKVRWEQELVFKILHTAA